MKRVFVFAVLVLTGVAFASENVEVNEFIVKTHNIPALQSFVAEHNLTIEPLITYPNPSQEVLDYTRGSYVVSFGTKEQEVADSLVGVLMTLEGMQYVEPNSVIQIEPDTFSSEIQPFNMPDSFPWPYTPNDPMYPQQWNINSMKVNWAWNLTTGNNVKIGIIDFGIDTDHEEFPSINYELSYDFYANNDNIEDTHGHGTRVAGVAAAKIDNGLGIAGVAGDCDLCILKTGKPNGAISSSAVAEALYYAADNGINVVNMSFGDHKDNQTVRTAIDSVGDSLFLVGAAGNENVDASTHFPSNHPKVLSVGGVTQNMQRWDNSNYGNWVDIYAPVGVPSTKNDGTYYDSRYGTSIASPQIAGLAALLFAENPSWTNQQVWDQILNTSDTITIDKGKVLFPNAMAALEIDSVGIAELPPETQPDWQVLTSVGREIVLMFNQSSSTLTLRVFDASGRQVDELHVPRTSGTVSWPVTPGAGHSPGVYFIVPQGGNLTAQKVVLVR